MLIGFLAVGCGRSPVARIPAATAPNVAVEPPRVPVDTLDAGRSLRLETARAAVQESPNSAAAWGRLGQLFDAAELASEAARCYLAAAEREPDSVRWHHLLARATRQDQPDQALVHARRATELAGTTNDAPRLALVQLVGELGRANEVESLLQELLRTRPEHPAARLELARAHLAAGQPETIPELLRPSLTNPYTMRPAWLLLAQARARTGDTSGADDAARRAAGLSGAPDWPDQFVREVQALRDTSEPLAERANGLLMQRRFPESERVIGELTNRFPDHAEGWLLLGRLRFQQQRCAEAEALDREYLRRQPDSLNGLVQLGLALLCQERWADAEAVWQRAITLKPDFAQAHLNRGLAQTRLEKLEPALASYREAVRCSPGDAAAHAALADGLWRVGQTGAAREAVARALKIDPQQPRAKAVQARLGSKQLNIER